MIFDPNPLYYEMLNLYVEYRVNQRKKITICNEGSSRSSKTWDFFHLLVTICDHNKNKELEIYMLRDVLVDCRDYTFKEFKKALKQMQIWDENKKVESPKPYYNLYGNHIYFRGLDDGEAPPSDIIFLNEGLEVDDKGKLKGWFMRCRILQVIDWNPKYTQHWCFELEGNPGVFFTRSNYKNNKHLSQTIIDEIESYCPWHFDDLELPENERRPHPTNVKNGTADKYQWLVYGEGKRCAPEGIIFNNVRYIDEWPIDVAPVRGLDFGFTVDPSALVNVGENSTDIFLELLMYESTDDPDIIHEFAIANDLDIRVPCEADSSDKYTGENKGTIEMVKALRKRGWRITKVSKTKSVMYWIGQMKKKRINIIKNHLYHHARKEHENYTLKKVNGIAINQPIDKFNHFWDGSRYGYMSLHKPEPQYAESRPFGG